MNKCEWKDGKFNGCQGFSEKVKLVQEYSGKWQTICKSCHADIRKPKPPEPIIKKSGETYVARFNGVDYLCLDPKEHESLVGTLEEGEGVEGIIKHFVYVWKPFSEIEITDEIAKLRPIVTNKHSLENYRLLGVIKTSMSVYSERFSKLSSQDTYSFRLATVEDL